MILITTHQILTFVITNTYMMLVNLQKYVYIRIPIITYEVIILLVDVGLLSNRELHGIMSP